MIWQQTASPPHMDGSMVLARWRQCAAHLIMLSLARPSPKSQMVFPLVQSFLHSSWRSHYTLQWAKWGDLNPHLIHGSLGPPESPTQTASRSVWPFLHGSVPWQTARPTDATRACNNRPHVCMTLCVVRWCSLLIIKLITCTVLRKSRTAGALRRRSLRLSSNRFYHRNCWWQNASILIHFTNSIPVILKCN